MTINIIINCFVSFINAVYTLDISDNFVVAAQVALIKFNMYVD